jgi:RND family efflux transporter MFP subunit
MRVSYVLPLAASLALAGCGKKNEYVPPPPAEVGVAKPLSRMVVPQLDSTGTTEAYDAVDLMARVQGFVQSIDYTDGQAVKQGQVLFTIEPAPFQAQLLQAQASLDSAQAQLVQTQAEFDRQSQLGNKDFSSRSSVDQARAARDTARASVTSAQAGVALAGINLGYTRVAAPFDGVATAHLVSVGDLVGASGPTKLASVVRMDPIRVSFSLAETDVQRIRTDMEKAGLKLTDLARVEVDVGLTTEQGTPHRGHLDYVSPTVDTATGTLALRAVFDNADRALLPGYFVRIRIPETAFASEALLVPQAAIASGQGGETVLAVGKDNIVEQRVVQAGETEGALRVIRKGLAPDDRVIIEGAARVEPGERVAARDVPMPGG